MHFPRAFDADPLTVEDRAALQELAGRLDPVRHEVAGEWSRRLTALLPEYFGPDTLSPSQLKGVNEAFLSLVMTHIQDDRIPALYETYYRRTCELIEADLQRAPALRLSLGGLYTSACVSLGVISDWLGPDSDRLMPCYRKLVAQLMMLVGQAYSDCREEYLQRMFEQINVLSHELRAPLSNLLGFLELLHAGEFGTISAEQEQVLSQLLRESDDLLWLLTGTLDLSRLETGRVGVRVEEFPLESVVKEVVHNTPHPSLAVTWSISPDVPALRTDRIKVKQLVGNLFRNAVRYGEGSAVTITATVPRAGYVEVRVGDRGPGIAPDKLGAIFDFFERGTGMSARDGYGIGLHVVRRVVGLLGGSVEVTSTPGEGACFAFTIPANGPEPLATPQD